MPLGRLGVNSLDIVRIHSGGSTAFQEFLSNSQFGFIIPLNDDVIGGNYILTPNNCPAMEAVYKAPSYSEDEEWDRNEETDWNDQDGGEIYSNYITKLLLAADRAATERNIEDILDRRDDLHKHKHKLKSSDQHASGFDSLHSTLVQMLPKVGSVVLFSAKTMAHKHEVSTGTRYALVGSIGYVEQDACAWYNQIHDDVDDQQEQKQEQKEVEYEEL